ncbi:hypothetical protein RUND412_008620 [Rhizina undulata]
MECLPAEILQEIVGRLSENDLDSVRLVNHQLSAAANVFKYRVLRVPMSRQGLDHLLYVSQQPALAHCVREIVYPWRYITPYSVAEARIQEELPPYCNQFTHLSQMAFLFVEWYNDTFYTPQVEVEDSGECITILKTALPRMPYIRRLCPGSHVEHITNQYGKWQGALKVDHRDFRCDEHLILYGLQRENGIYHKARAEKRFLDLIDVSCRVGLKPDSLSSTVPAAPTAFSQPCIALWHTFFTDSSGILRNCTPLLENLTSLTCCVSIQAFDEGHEVFRRECEEGKFHKFLSSVPNLRSLFLEFACTVPLLEIFGRTRIWNHLHTLRFKTYGSAGSEELAQILNLYSPTLKDLSLIFSELIGSITCRDILDILKERFCLAKFKMVVINEDTFQGQAARKD